MGKAQCEKADSGQTLGEVGHIGTSLVLMRGFSQRTLLFLGSEPEKERRSLCYKIVLHVAQPPSPGHHFPPTETMGNCF